MTGDERGIALTMALVVLVILEGLAALGLAAATTRYRLTSDARFAIESGLVASTALAMARTSDANELATMPDGGELALPALLLPPGWVGRGEAFRHGSLIRLVVGVGRRRLTGELQAAARATLLLVLDPTDTLRVLHTGARF